MTIQNVQEGLQRAASGTGALSGWLDWRLADAESPPISALHA